MPHVLLHSDWLHCVYKHRALSRRSIPAFISWASSFLTQHEATVKRSRAIIIRTIGQLGESLEGHFTTESILLHQEPSMMEVGMMEDRVKGPNHKLQQEKPENLHSCISTTASRGTNVTTPAVADEG
ncbi:hypothetical protein RRG08_042841 [Elysia crispata]|uniref:Uncharacterized protein n=1 Tax=Elysia crispata TaxID=231223 RepID=A0AAE1DZ64_9GAST|nr:hypothetical protein RRG08_042841 [Elysia crispata]